MAKVPSKVVKLVRVDDLYWQDDELMPCHGWKLATYIDKETFMKLYRGGLIERFYEEGVNRNYYFWVIPDGKVEKAVEVLKKAGYEVEFVRASK